MAALDSPGDPARLSPQSKELKDKKAWSDELETGSLRPILEESVARRFGNAVVLQG